MDFVYGEGFCLIETGSNSVAQPYRGLRIFLFLPPKCAEIIIVSHYTCSGRGLILSFIYSSVVPTDRREQQRFIVSG